jgi:uncharacterized protein
LEKLFDQISATKSGFSTLLEKMKNLDVPDAAHAFSHFERVAKLAVEIFEREKVILSQEGISENKFTNEDCEDAAVAALLHDCVPVPKDSPLRKESSRLSSEEAKRLLTEVKWGSEERIAIICGAIHDHSYSSGRIPTSLLGESLQDADRLESLGAIGLYRVIATGVAMKAELFHPADPWAKNRALDDYKFSIDHFPNKLFKLPAGFRTFTARQEAEKRASFLQSFLDQLKLEIGE